MRPLKNALKFFQKNGLRQGIENMFKLSKFESIGVELSGKKMVSCETLEIFGDISIDVYLITNKYVQKALKSF